MVRITIITAVVVIARSVITADWRGLTQPSSFRGRPNSLLLDGLGLLLTCKPLSLRPARLLRRQCCRSRRLRRRLSLLPSLFIQGDNVWLRRRGGLAQLHDVIPKRGNLHLLGLGCQAWAHAHTAGRREGGSRGMAMCVARVGVQ